MAELFAMRIPCYGCRISADKRNEIAALVSPEYIPPSELEDFFHSELHDGNPFCTDCIESLGEDTVKKFDKAEIKCHRCFALNPKKKETVILTILFGYQVSFDTIYAFQDRGSYYANFFCIDCVKEMLKEEGYTDEDWGNLGGE
jgi:hypothetical protein